MARALLQPQQQLAQSAPALGRVPLAEQNGHGERREHRNIRGGQFHVPDHGFAHPPRDLLADARVQRVAHAGNGLVGEAAGPGQKLRGFGELRVVRIVVHQRASRRVGPGGFFANGPGQIENALVVPRGIVGASAQHKGREHLPAQAIGLDVFLRAAFEHGTGRPHGNGLADVALRVARELIAARRGQLRPHLRKGALQIARWPQVRAQPVQMFDKHRSTPHSAISFR